MTDRLLADLILIVHTAFIAFVIGGLLLTLVGGLANWQWVRNRWFRLAHFGAVALVVFQQLLNIPCPLTVWENQLRASAGEATYPGGFIVYWLRHLIFFDFQPWVFDVIYVVFGLLVVLTLFVAPIRWRPSK